MKHVLSLLAATWSCWAFGQLISEDGLFAYSERGDGSAGIYAYLGPMGAGAVATVPEAIDGKPVTALEAGGVFLATGSSIEGVALPASLESVAFFAFQGVKAFIVVPGTCATFASVDGALYDKAQSMLYAVPTAVAPTLPETLTTILPGAFIDNAALRTFTIPASVTLVAEHAFANTSLETFTIPATDVAVAETAFSGSTARVEVAEGNANYAAIDGLFCDKALKELYHIPAGRTGTLRIPDGFTTLGPAALSGRCALAELIFPASLTTFRTGYGTQQPWVAPNLTAIRFLGPPPAEWPDEWTVRFDGNLACGAQGYYPAAHAAAWEAALDENGRWRGLPMQVATEEPEEPDPEDPDGGDSPEGFAWGAATSAPVRVDTRATRVATAIERVHPWEEVTCDGSPLVSGEWDTAALADGVHRLAAATNAVDVLTLNAGAQVVGGRLTADTTWDGGTWVVRDWVVVPAGTTLTVGTGTAVKFVPGAGIWVEDGGTVAVRALSAGEPAVFTALADDAAGGDTNGDGAGSVPGSEDFRIVVAPEGTLSDEGQLEVRHGAAVPGWQTVRAGDAVTSELYAEVRVPITVGGLRENVAVSVHWETVDGTATAGTDYTAASGTLMWAQGEPTTQYAVIPILRDDAEEETETFTVRLSAVCGLNVTRGTATVTLNDAPEDADPFAGFACGTATSAPVRADTRDTLGGQLAHGIVTLGAPDGASGAAVTCDGTPLADPAAWDTATVTNGTHALAQADAAATVVTLNDPAVEIVYGRLAEDRTWGPEQTRLVRNWVVVPSGRTLTVAAGAVVKFCPGAGIWVEDGGTLRVEGAEAALAVFTHAADNAFGATISGAGEAPAMDDYAIVKAPGATFTDNGWLAVRWHDVATFGRVTLHAAQAPAAAGEVRVPVTVSGSREAPFVVRWVAEPDTARLGEDYTVASGELRWEKAAEGTKHIVIPTLDNPANTDRRTFTVRAQIVCGMNAAPEPVTVTLYRNGLDTTLGAPFGSCATASAPIRVDTRAGDAGRLAYDVERVHPWEGATCDGTALTAGEWRLAGLEDAWHTLAGAEGEAEVRTLTDPFTLVEGGRLKRDTTWNMVVVGPVLTVVRHWVVVPQGVTLVVPAGSIVKFAPGAGIWVEDGGALVIEGAEGQDVIFTHLADDSVGGDTDARPQPEDIPWDDWRIVRAPGATVTDNGFWQVRYHTRADGFAAVTLHDAIAEERQGALWVPLTVSGSREVPFSVDWEVVGDTADFTGATSGTIAWEAVKDGTRFITLPLAQDAAIEGHEPFTVRLTAVRGANCSDREATVTVYDAAPTVDGAALAASYVAPGNAPTSPAATLRAPTGLFQDSLIVDGAQDFRYSPYWQDDPADWRDCTTEIAFRRVDGADAGTLFRGEPGAEGNFRWQVRNQDDGLLTVTHRVLGPDGTPRASASVLLRYIAAVALHAGRIAADETWPAGKVHLIYGDVIVAPGVTLTIEPGAIVKFCDGTGLYSEDYTATTIAEGVIFTHFADDTVGGDTNLDGDATQPEYGAYDVSGAHIVTDADSAFRCRQETTLSGTQGSLTMTSGNVYIVSRDVTFPNGTALTIEPGVIVKVADGASIRIDAGAMLHAEGTRAEPIVITSLRDDSVGGDTNGDGAATQPQPGSWQSIAVNGGTAHFENTHIRYACRSQQGAIYQRGGTVTFRNGSIVESRYDAVGVETGDFSMENSVVSGAATAFRHYPRGPIVNCVFYGVGKLTQGGGQDFRNCIFMDIDTAWEAFGWSSRYSHCVFWNSDGASVVGGSDAMTQVGKNGNVWGDPLFVNALGGDFHIQPGSAAVDMADGAAAPETDYYGQPRMDVEESPNLGTAAANGAFPDAGIHELMPRTATADVDLAVSAVEVPAAGTVADTATFAWEVRNLGAEAVEGTWRDTLSLVDDAGREVALGVVQVSGFVAPGGSKRTERTLTLPPMPEGTWRLKVVANAWRDVFEGALTANNAATSADTLAVSAETLPAGVTETFLLANEWLACRVPPQTGDGFAVGVSANVPVSAVFAATPFLGEPAATAATREVSFAVGAVGGWLYVANGGDAELANVRLTLEERLSLAGVSPGLVPAGPQDVTLTVRGAGFVEGLAATLHRAGGDPIPAQSVERVSSAELRLRFALGDAPEGAVYALTVTDGRRTATLDEALLASSLVSLSGLKAELQIPDAVRPGRVYEGAILYENTADAPIPVPLFKITLAGSDGRLAHVGDDKPWADTLFGVGLGAGTNRGLLRPGEKGRLPFRVATDGTALSVSFATVATDDLGARASLWPTYPDLARALSEAVAALAPTLAADDFDATLYLDWAADAAQGAANAVLAGQLLFPDGQPAANVALDLVGSGGAIAATLATDDAGAFRVANLAPGDYALAADWLRAARPATLPARGCVADLTVVCEPLGRLHGTVVNASGAPVAGATLRATLGETCLNATSDASGAWAMLGDCAAGGEIVVRDGTGFHAEATVAVEPVPAGEARTLRIVLEATGRCSGTVALEDGGALPEGFTLTFRAGTQTVATAAVGADGAFAAGTLPPGAYTLAFPYGFATANPAVTIRAGQETRLTLTLTRTSPIACPPAYQPVGGRTTYTVTAPDATNVRWDFDGDGQVDATGPSVEHGYDQAGDYRPIVTYEQGGTEKTWQAPEPIVVCPPATVTEGTVSVYDGSGWEIAGQAEGEVTLRRTDDPTEHETLAPGDHLLLWGQENPAVRVTEVRQEGDGTVCAVEPATLDAVFEPEAPGVDITKSPLYVGSCELDESFTVSAGLNASKNVDIVFDGDASMGGGIEVGYSYTLRLQGRLTLYKSPTGTFILDAELRRTGTSAFTGVEAKFGLNLSKRVFTRTFMAGPVPICFTFDMGANGHIAIGSDFALRKTEWDRRRFLVDTRGMTVLDASRGETPLVSEGLGSGGHIALDFSAGASAMIGVGAATKNWTVTLADIEIAPGFYANFTCDVHDETQPDTWSLEAGVKMGATVNLLHAELFGFEGTAASFDLQPDARWPWLKAGGTTPVPSIRYNIPAGGEPGEVEVYPGASVAPGRVITAREWSLDGTRFATEAPAEAAPRYRLALPSIISTEAGEASEKPRDWHVGVVGLRHFVGTESGEPFILANLWKAAERKIVVFVEDGVTQPMDSEGVAVPQSCDPNEMGGPAGVGPERKVRPGQWLTYTVYFENMPEATGAAQEVRVTHRLDPDLDWTTFELVDVAYRNQTEPALAGLAAGTAESALAGTPYKVRTEAAFDPASGLAEWYLRIVDDSTPDKWPADAYAGILPPNNAAHEGEGHVTYRVKVRDDAPDGARIDATATIVFDLNDPIETDPAWWNTVAHTIDTARFAAPTLEAQGPDGMVVVTVQGGSAEAATAVDLRVVGGSMALGTDYFFPESIRLKWAKGDTAPKTFYLTFDPAALALGDKTILLGLENADGLALDAADKTCAVTIRRHVPALGWPEEAGQPSEALAAWVTEAAARALVADGPLSLAPGTTLGTLEQARALGVYPALTPLAGGGAMAEVRVALRVAAILPADGALRVTARVVAEAGILADPYAPEASFALRGGASLDEASWAETAPDAVGTPTRRSDTEADIPLRFADPPLPNAFFRLLAR